MKKTERLSLTYIFVPSPCFSLLRTVPSEYRYGKGPYWALHGNLRCKTNQLISEYFQVSVGKKTTLGSSRKRGVGVSSAGRSTQVAPWHGEEFYEASGVTAAQVSSSRQVSGPSTLQYSVFYSFLMGFAKDSQHLKVCQSKAPCRCSGQSLPSLRIGVARWHGVGPCGRAAPVGLALAPCCRSSGGIAFFSEVWAGPACQGN